MAIRWRPAWAWFVAGVPPGILELASPRRQRRRMLNADGSKTMLERPRPEQTPEQERQLWARDREFRTGVGARTLPVRGRIGNARASEDVSDLLTAGEWLRAQITWWTDEVRYQRSGWQMVIHALEIGEEIAEEVIEPVVAPVVEAPSAALEQPAESTADRRARVYLDAWLYHERLQWKAEEMYRAALMLWPDDPLLKAGSPRTVQAAARRACELISKA